MSHSPLTSHPGIPSPKFRYVVLAICVWSGSSTFVRAQTNELPGRDLSGYALDMTIRQVEAVSHTPLQPLGGGQFKVTANGVNYDFGFSVLGHLFRINSMQNLGNFIPDAAFARTLTEKLSKKFGPPGSNQLPDGPIGWGALEHYTDTSGLRLNREAWGLSAYLTGGFGQPIELNMKLFDFRIMRRDLDRANAAPRTKAADGVKY
jgi:hypothetical protein